MSPGVSAGSKKVGASVKCTAHVIWPAGASVRPACAFARGAAGSEARESATATKNERTQRERFMTTSLLGIDVSCRRAAMAGACPRPSRTAGQARRRLPRGQANECRSTAMYEPMEMTYCLVVEEEMRAPA